jgi:hypothetical protein
LFLGSGFVDKAGTKKSTMIFFSRKTWVFVQPLLGYFAHKKTPLNTPVTLADRRKSSML